jgi:hypothetical protein
MHTGAGKMYGKIMKETNGRRKRSGYRTCG